MKTNKKLENRFNFLKNLFANSPLSESDFLELKTLAQKFDPKMVKCLEEIN